MDDINTPEACPRGKEQRLLVATASAVSDHCRMLGIGASNPVPGMSQKKLTECSVGQEVLGYWLDFQRMTIDFSWKNIVDVRQVLG